MIQGASYCDSSIAFGMIRKGMIDMTILGALQVSERGDLANWIVPGKKVPGMGGAMELAQKAKKVVVVMNHNDKNGHSKIFKNCTLPLTSARCVDLIITELAVFHVNSEGLTLREYFSTTTIEEIKARTACSFQVYEHIKKIEG